MYEKIENDSMEFTPLTSRLGISGTSYGIQLGIINSKWTSILLHGEKRIAVNIYQDRYENIPEIHQIINWTLNTIPIPNINPRHVSMTVSLLIKQATENKEKKKEIISIEETKNIKLKSVLYTQNFSSFKMGWIKNTIEPETIFKNIEKLRTQINQLDIKNIPFSNETANEIITQLEILIKKTREITNHIFKKYKTERGR